MNGHLSVTIRENRAVAKDRGRPLTSTFLPYKSYLKRISTITFAEVEVLFPTRYELFLNFGPFGDKKYLKFRATLDQPYRRFAKLFLANFFSGK